MKVLDVMVCLAAMAAPGLSMKMNHLAERQDSSTPTPGGRPPLLARQIVFRQLIRYMQ